MPKKRELSEVERGQIVLLKKQGVSIHEIVRQMNFPRCAVRTTIRRFEEIGCHKNKPRSGRKKVTTIREERILERMSLRNRRLSSKDLSSQLYQQYKVKISPRTMRRRLCDVGLKGCKARRKPYLTPAHKKQRLLWARKYKNWTSEDWAKVMWTDESNIEVSIEVHVNYMPRFSYFYKQGILNKISVFLILQLFGHPGAGFVRRRSGEAYNSECIIPTVKFRGGSIMIWGSMATTGVEEIFICEGRMNSERYIDMLEETLEASFLKLFGEMSPNYHFQQDNAPCHKSKRVLEWFKNNQIKILDWPPQSPDLSPIEHLWTVLKTKVAQSKCSSKELLKEKIRTEWNELSSETCKKLVDSMPRRIESVIRAKGGFTKY